MELGLFMQGIPHHLIDIVDPTEGLLLSTRANKRGKQAALGALKVDFRLYIQSRDIRTSSNFRI